MQTVVSSWSSFVALPPYYYNYYCCGNGALLLLLLLFPNNYEYEQQKLLPLFLLVPVLHLLSVRVEALLVRGLDRPAQHGTHPLVQHLVV